MKRFSTLLLCCTMLLNIAACSSSEAPSSTEAPVSTTVPATEAELSEQAPTEAPAQSVAMDETVLVDNDDAAFIITKVENSDHLGMQLHVQCINKGDRTLLFSWDMVSVCGYMYDPLWATEVAAGKTANTTIELDTFALGKMGVASVDEITFTLRISDSENWMEAPVTESVYTIYPTGLSADAFVLPAHPESPSQVVIADDENIRFVIEGMEETNSAAVLRVYLENKTDRNLLYSWDLVSVNGMMIDPFWATSVTAGKRACAEISFRHADLEANGITDISEIEFQLIVSDYDNWDTPNLLAQRCIYHP